MDTVPLDLTKRFIAFSYMQYYPAGAMNDAIGSYNTEEEAIVALRADNEVWGDYKQIFDKETGSFYDVGRT